MSKLTGGRIRPMQYSDVTRIAQLEKLCFTMPWPREAIVSDLNNSIARYFVFDFEQEVIAYAGMWLIVDEAHVTNVAVAPEYRKRGLGKTMMLALVKEAVSKKASMMTLECRVSNQTAQSMYKSLGFDICGIREKYYHDNNEDAYVMWNKNIKKLLGG